MKVTIGDMIAWCLSCGATDFDVEAAEPAGPGTHYRCKGCGHTVGYGALLEQISERVIEGLKGRSPKE